jgi:hypothetical protein
VHNLVLNSQVIKALPYSVRRLFAVIGLMPSLAFAIEYDLSGAIQSVRVQGDVGGTAVFANYWTQPTGTGVFDPFLTLQAKGNKKTEQAYNTDGKSFLYMDETRPEWNTTLKLGDLALINQDNVNYYAFILDANEPGGAKSVISVDNIRIYTSPSDNTASVKSNQSNLDDLGTLRWAMNDPLMKSTLQYNVDDWVKLDANQQNIGKNANGGSGMADMIVYIPQSAFSDAAASDFVWFYNLNGVHWSTDYTNSDPNLSAQCGYEEWRAVEDVPRHYVPDGGSTLVMLGLGLLGGAWMFHRHGLRKN